MTYFRPARAYVAALYVPEAVADAFQASSTPPPDAEWLDVASLATASGGEFPRTLRIVFVQDAPARHVADGFIRSFKARLAALEKAAAAGGAGGAAVGSQGVLEGLGQRLALVEARLRERLAVQRTAELQDDLAHNSKGKGTGTGAVASSAVVVTPAEVAIEPSEWGEAIAAEFTPSEQSLLPLLRSSPAATDARLQQLEAALTAVGTFRAGDEVVLTATAAGGLLVTLPRGFSAAAAMDGDAVLAVAEDRARAELWAAAAAAAAAAPTASSSAPAVPVVPPSVADAAAAQAIAALRARAAALTSAASAASAAAEAALRARGAAAAPSAADLPSPVAAAAEAALALVARYTAEDAAAAEAAAAARAARALGAVEAGSSQELDASAAAAAAAVAAAFATVSDPLSVRRCLDAGARVSQHNATVARRRDAAAAESIAESIAEGVSEEKRAMASAHFPTPTLSPSALPTRPALLLTAPRLTVAVLATYLARDGVSGDIRARLSSAWRLLLSGPAARGDPDPHAADGGAAALVAALQAVVEDAGDCERGVQPRDPRFAAVAAQRLRDRWDAARAAEEAASGLGLGLDGTAAAAATMTTTTVGAGQLGAGKNSVKKGPPGDGPGPNPTPPSLGESVGTGSNLSGPGHGRGRGRGREASVDDLALPPELEAEAARRKALADAVDAVDDDEDGSGSSGKGKEQGIFKRMFGKVFGGSSSAPTSSSSTAVAPAAALASEHIATPEPASATDATSAPPVVAAAPVAPAAPGTVGRSPTARFLHSLRIAIAELDAATAAQGHRAHGRSYVDAAGIDYGDGNDDVYDDDHPGAAAGVWANGSGDFPAHVLPTRTTTEFLALLRRAQLDSGVTPDALPREQRAYLLDRAADLIYAVPDPAPAPPPAPSDAEAAAAAAAYARAARRGERVGLGLGSADTASLGVLEPVVNLNEPLPAADCGRWDEGGAGGGGYRSGCGRGVGVAKGADAC